MKSELIIRDYTELTSEKFSIIRFALFSLLKSYIASKLVSFESKHPLVKCKRLKEFIQTFLKII